MDKVYKRIMEAYDSGRNTSFSNQEMQVLVQRYLPEYFPSEFDHLKEYAHRLASQLIEKLAETAQIRGLTCESASGTMEEFVDEYPFIQFLYLTDTKGKLVCSMVASPMDRPKYDLLSKDADFSGREWFLVPMQTGRLHITDFYRSNYTGRLCLTVASPVVNARDEIIGVLGGDIRFEELLKRQGDLDDEQLSEEVD